jgi:hypothetical protein
MDELERDLGRLREAATAKRAAEQREAVVEALASTVSKALNLRPDELAILMLSQDRSFLEFIYPAGLAEGSNRFPLSVPSLAGRVVQTARSVLINTAHDVPHLGFYERIKIKEERPRQIQKLLAVGVKGYDGKVQAVIEVSSRGDTLAEAGPDFRPEDQRILEVLQPQRLRPLASPSGGRLHRGPAGLRHFGGREIT